MSQESLATNYLSLNISMQCQRNVSPHYTTLKMNGNVKIWRQAFDHGKSDIFYGKLGCGEDVNFLCKHEKSLQQHNLP